MADSKVYTAKDLIRAIKQNQIPWGRSTFFLNAKGDHLYVNYANEIVELNDPSGHGTEASIEKACVLGVAAINLGIRPTDISLFVEKKHIASTNPKDHSWCVKANICEDIVRYNDGQADSWEDASAYAIRLLEKYPDATFIAYPFDYEGKVKVPA